MQALLANGALIEELDETGCTPLYYAVRHGHVEIVKLSLDHRANVNAKDYGDRTPLHEATAHGHTEIVRL